MPRTKLKKRKDGRYRKLFNGIPFYGYTEKEAIDKANAYQRDIEAGLRAEQAGITVQEYANRWVQIHKANVSTNQYNDYVRRLNTVCEYIGSKRMRDVVMSDIQLIYNELLNGKSKSTITKFTSMIKSLFGSAQIDRIIMHNPCLAAKPPKGYSGSHRALEPWERDAVHQMQQTDHRFAAAAMTMLYAGLRRGEVLALNIDRDVDFKAKVIHVREAVHFESNRDKLGKPKTEAGVRDVPLVDVLADVLKDKHGLLITGASGEYMTLSAFQRAWESYLTKTEAMLNGMTQKRWYGKTKEQQQLVTDGGELPPWKEFNVRTHDFRHSYCTMLYELGIDIKTAQAWMGHEDEAMTRQIYTHLSTAQLQNATALLQKGVQERVKNRVNLKQRTEKSFIIKGYSIIKPSAWGSRGRKFESCHPDHRKVPSYRGFLRLLISAIFLEYEKMSTKWSFKIDKYINKLEIVDSDTAERTTTLSQCFTLI